MMSAARTGAVVALDLVPRRGPGALRSTVEGGVRGRDRGRAERGEHQQTAPPAITPLARWKKRKNTFVHRHKSPDERSGSINLKHRRA